MTTTSTITIGNSTAWTKGSYLAYLAPWGASGLVQGKDYYDTLTFTGDLFPNSATMSWKYPEKAPTASGVYNFNSINFGNYNFTQVANPIQASKVKDITSLTQTQSLKLGGDGSKYDVTTDFFLTSRAGDQTTKLFEVQVFLHTPEYTKWYVQSVTGLGTYTDAQGRAWTVAIDYKANLAPDILLMPKDGKDITSGSVDIKGMLDWLTTKGVLTGNEYFNGLGMGVEVRQGSGTMTIDNFAVDYGTKAPAGLSSTAAGQNLYAPVIDTNGGGASAKVSVLAGTTAVTTVHAYDKDGTVPLYFIKGGADAALFSIDKYSGKLVFKEAPSYGAPKDAGANNVYDVVVQVIDGKNATVQALAVTVTSPNQYAPVIDTNGGGASATINVASGAKAVTTVHAVDADGTTPTYAIAGGADAALFTIDAKTGALVFKEAASYGAPKDVGGDNTYNVVVRATDGTYVDDQALAVTVRNTYAPVIDTNGGGASAKIGVVSGTKAVTTVHAVDADGTTPTYAISGGADAALFTIDAKTGALAFKVAPSYAAPKDAGGDNTYDVTVRATDGSYVDDQALSVSVSNAGVTAAMKAALGLVVDTATKTLAVTNDQYDANWKMVRTLETEVVRFDNGKQIVEQYDAKGKLTGATIATASDGKEVIQHFDAKWAFAGAEVVSYGAQTVTDHYDANWKVTSHELFVMQDGRAVEQHFDANWAFLGAEVGSVNGTKKTVDYYDATWKATGHDTVYVADGKLTTQHFDAGWKFAGAETETFVAAQASNHDVMKGWLMA